MKHIKRERIEKLSKEFDKSTMTKKELKHFVKCKKCNDILNNRSSVNYEKYHN